MGMDYSKINEIVKERLKQAHDTSKESVRKEFFEAEYKFFNEKIKGKRVLVAGSGLGHDSLEIARNNNEVIGIELVKDYVNISKKKADEKNLKNVKFLQGDFRKIPFEKKSFDVAVLNMGTISDFKDKKTILKELLRVAKMVYFDFYPPTTRSLEKRMKMYEEENWKNVRIESNALISDEGLFSESITKKKIKDISEELGSEVRFFDFCDFATMAKLTQEKI